MGTVPPRARVRLPPGSHPPQADLSLPGLRLPGCLGSIPALPALPGKPCPICRWEQLTTGHTSSLQHGAQSQASPIRCSLSDRVQRLVHWSQALPASWLTTFKFQLPFVSWALAEPSADSRRGKGPEAAALKILEFIWGKAGESSFWSLGDLGSNPSLSPCWWCGPVNSCFHL